jgi:hypothetical protein
MIEASLCSPDPIGGLADDMANLQWLELKLHLALVRKALCKNLVLGINCIRNPCSKMIGNSCFALVLFHNFYLI